jgi:hypothetical protein
MLLKELGKENQISYSNDMRMSTVKFEELLQIKGKGKAVPLQSWSGPEGSR